MKLLRLAPGKHQDQLHAVSPRELSAIGAAVDLLRADVLQVGMNFGIDFAGGTQVELRAKAGVADLASCAPRPKR